MNAIPNVGKNRAKLSLVHLPGLQLDTLGHYLAALGLLRLASRKWPSLRACWRNDSFVLVGEARAIEEIVDYVDSVGQASKWTLYSKPWDAVQKKDTKAKQASYSALWRARDASEQDAVLFQSHLATGARLSFNPLFGTGGNSGKRLFSGGWSKAAKAVANPPAGWKGKLRHDLFAFLSGGSCFCLGDFNAASWFSAANKIFNSGMARPFREGQVTPWAMLLACEAFPILAGTASRWLGAHRRATGAFPFVTQGAAPENEQEAGRVLGEFWAPVWSQPLTLAESTALFQRGKAEVDGRGAVTAPAFAAAILKRGTDSGIAEFRRFLLLKTTSENTFESQLRAVVPVLSREDTVQSQAIRVALALRDQLPRDFKKGKRWVYRGLQGVVDRALIELAEGGAYDHLRGEHGLAVVDALFGALQRVDRNKTYRGESVRFELLPAAWLDVLVGEHERVREFRLAAAIASLRAARLDDAPRDKHNNAPSIFLPYRLGVTVERRFCLVPKEVPFRRVWSTRGLSGNLSAVVQRRLIETPEAAEPPFSGTMYAQYADVLDWLDGHVDETVLERWIDRCSLFDWSAPLLPRLANSGAQKPANALNSFYAFFRPLFDPTALNKIRGSKTGDAPKSGVLRPITAMIGRGDIGGAWSVARSVYARLGVPLADFPVWQEFTLMQPQRLSLRF
jgi:CRISPR-associated protein Csx17